MGRVIVCTGIPGVGKTTVLNEVAKMASSIGKKVRIVNYGTVMLELAKERKLEVQRDELRRLPINIQQELQAEAAKRLARMAEEVEVLIIDTHMVVRTTEGYWPGLPWPVLEQLKPSLFVLIEAQADEILERRKADETRARDLVPEIREELEFSRALASACGALTGSPIKIVQNEKGKQVEAARQILNLI